MNNISFMFVIMKNPSFQILILLFFSAFCDCFGLRRHHIFVIQETPYTRLCNTKSILTVNGQFPGPTLHVRYGETVIVDVINKADHNITIHWHGVNQPRNPWSDGPEYITQCPIRPGQKFSQKVIFTVEEGTLWWHAHSDWSRATVHGAIVIHPKDGNYPFPKPYAEQTIILDEWWKEDVFEVLKRVITTGGSSLSDAYMINGQPGDLFPCSKSGTFKLTVDHGKIYLLRVVNAALGNLLFFAIANHSMTVVGADGSYVKPFKSDYLTISPGQTMDILLETNRPLGSYYMAAKAYSSGRGVPFDNNTSTAILQYRGSHAIDANSSRTPLFPSLPSSNDTTAFFSFARKFRSLVDKHHPIDVPLNIDTPLTFIVSANRLNGAVVASMNNISFATPIGINILQAYYNNISGVFSADFPDTPPLVYNYTGDNLPAFLLPPKKATEVEVLEYNSTVEIVLQGTNLLAGEEHPIHLHGHSFYVVGSGFGNFDKDKDPLGYNLVDPPLLNTIAIPKNGWTTIRFRANNPGVWFMHCHLERHTTWGMVMTFIVKNGDKPEESILPPPSDMPSC